MRCDVLIVGGGTGGVAAALSLANKGLSVVLTEETNWLGGQLTSQLVPPDEHPWIESFGCTARYRKLRNATRQAYFDRNSPRIKSQIAFGPNFNPGGGWVSRICAEPPVFHHVLEKWIESTETHVYLDSIPVSASVSNHKVDSVSIQNHKTGETWTIEPRFVLDATELGDLLPLSKTEYISGAESKSQTDEPHALDGPAEPANIQSFTWCAVIGFDSNGDHTIEKPEEYDSWKEYIPPHWTGQLLDLTFPNVRTGAPMTLPLFSDSASEDWTLFGYRQIVTSEMYETLVEPATVMNWPQNDYMLGEVIDRDSETVKKHYRSAKNLTRSVLYWLQTDLGYKGLRFRPDLAGTEDGLAKAPYHRESRRIRSLRTICEQDISPETNPGLNISPDMWDSIGIGAYRIDLHPSCNGAKTIDISCLPFQIPLGAIIPAQSKNLLPACKNIGTTHITNGCYRLHPVEWNIGEVAGLLAFFCLTNGLSPQDIYGDKTMVSQFQSLVRDEGIETSWPHLRAL